MTLNEFIDYLEQQLSSKNAFYDKSLTDQNARNKRRSPANKRWSDEKILKTIDNQWKELMNSIYNKVRPKVKKTAPTQKGWLDYFTENADFIESIDNSIYEIEFE